MSKANMAPLSIRPGGVARFVAEVRAELEKCSWPWNPREAGPRRYKELLDATLAVAVSALVLAAFVTGADLVFARALGVLTH